MATSFRFVPAAAVLLLGQAFFGSGPAGAIDGPALDLTASLARAAGAVPPLEVRAGALSFDRGTAPAITLPVKLGAKFGAKAAGGLQILSSVLSVGLKGGPEEEPGAALNGEPVTELSFDEPITVPVGPAGALAQRAVSLCNVQAGAKPSTAVRDLEVPAVIRWRVELGRFDFRRASLDRAGLDADLARDAGYYTDRTHEETEIGVLLPVHCLPAATAVDGKVAAQDAHSSHAFASKTTAAGVSVEGSAGKPAAVVAYKPSCSGGYLREVPGPGAVCLCPANTTRVAATPEGFRCERRSARR